MAVKVLIADDHKIVREGLCAMFATQTGMEVVGEAADGVAAIRIARELRPDVVIIDVNMPNMDGIDAAQRLLKELPETKIIALSIYAKKAFVTKMLDVGASGYVLKGVAFSELAEAVNTVMTGQVYLCATATTVLVDEYVDRSGKGRSTLAARLTDRELTILEHLAEGKPSKEIALLLDISVQAVDATRRRIMQKLDIESLAELIKYAIRQGLTSIDN